MTAASEFWLIVVIILLSIFSYIYNVNLFIFPLCIIGGLWLLLNIYALLEVHKISEFEHINTNEFFILRYLHYLMIKYWILKLNKFINDLFDS